MTAAGRGPLDVWFVSTTLDQGGAQRVTSTLLQHLDRDLLRPTLCLLRDQVGFPLPGNVPVHRLGYSGLRSFPAAAWRLARLIDRHRPDLVCSTVNANNLLAGVALRATRHRPCWVARFGNAPSLHDGRLRRVVARRIYGHADRVVTNSRGLAQEVVACYPAVRGRPAVLPNPTDFEALDAMAAQPAPQIVHADGPLLLAVGRLFPQKRYDVMLHALARVRERVPARLWVCGSGPLREQLALLTRDLGLTEAVAWLGHCDNPYALMAQADLFLLTSDHEGLPNALIEAQGLGLAAVSTRCPHGPDEIVDADATGLLVPVGDPEAVAQAVLALLEDPQRRQAMGAAARLRARERFDCAALTRRWEELLCGCVGAREAVPVPVGSQ